MKTLHFLKEHRLLCAFFIFSSLIITICSSNSFLYHVSSCHDAGVYYTVAKGMLQGKVLYRDLFDHKGPFIYFIYAAYNLFFPCKLYGAYFMDLICYGVISAFSYKLFRIKFSNNISVCLTSVYFSILLIANDSFGCVEIFSILLNTILLYWMYAHKTNQNRYLIFFGLMTGILLMIKFTLAVFPFVMFLLFLYDNIKNNASITLTVKKILILTFTMMLPMLCSLIYLIKTDTVSLFMDTYIFANKNYASLNSIDAARIMIIVLMLIILCFFGRHTNIREKIFLLAFMAQFITITISKPFPYTYLPLMILVLFALYKLNFPDKFEFRSMKFVCKLLICMCTISLLTYFLCSKCANSVHNIVSSYQKEYAHAAPNDLALFCISAEIFIEQKEAPANKYFFTPNFTYSENPEMWDELYSMIENKIPDNIYIPVYCGEELIISSFYIGKLPSDAEKAKKILLKLKENYSCEKQYENNLYRWIRKSPES